DIADRAVDELSGGQLQRVWLACCLAQDTGVLLLDEPTTFLHLLYQVELLDLVRDLADRGDIAVGLVLHDLDHAAAVADELHLIADGRIRACGPPADRGDSAAGLVRPALAPPAAVPAELPLIADGRIRACAPPADVLRAE